MKIFDESHVLIPLFHQTSSLFMPSIREAGLGMVNPHEELGTYKFLRELLELSDGLEGIPLTESDLDILRRMSDQQVTRGGFNFRHGGVYLSPSRRKAACYARGNPYGSELLSESLRLYGVLRALGADAESIGVRYPALVSLVDSIVTPVMVIVQGVPLDHLRTERGGDPLPILNMMQATVDDLGPDQAMALWEMHAFELCQPVSVGGFRTFEIIWKEPSTRNLSHRLEEI